MSKTGKKTVRKKATVKKTVKKSSPKNETFAFQTEVNQLLDLMVHSLYSQKEIFLRELISNSSDAVDRLRFDALTNADLLNDGDELGIRVEIDKENRTLTVSDNGIGMNHNEVIDNIGTIASSGTRKFVDAITGDDKQDINLIGQFGVGFYSVFMVADKVTLQTRKAGDKATDAVRWTSDGKGEYQLESVVQADRGTSITLHMRKDEDEFLESFRLRSIINKYSDHIALPIHMVRENLPGSDEEEDADKPAEVEWETVNTGTALWARPKKDISEEEYNNFYQSLTYDTEAPMSVLHHKVEGSLEYTSLLYLPKKAPFDLFNREQRHGLKLYVRRIFIMDDAEHLMPAYLRFVRGVIDSADLPLNVSREHLQHNREIEKIKAGAVKRVLTELKKLADDTDSETYQEFWKEFGQVLKEGIVEDFTNKDEVAALLRFASSGNDSADQTVSLEDYVKRMADDQGAIYYVTADSYAAATGSPHLEIFRKKGIEVLLLSDPIDEWVVSHLHEFKETPLKSVAKGALEDLSDDEDKDNDKQQKEFKDVLEKITAALGEQVKEVRLTHRLTESPACLVADENEPGANLERILKAAGQEAPEFKPILELNPEHAIIESLDAGSADIEDWAFVLFEQAALSEGGQVRDPANYVKRVNKLLVGTA